MKKIKVNNIRNSEIFEHLEFIVKNTTPYTRYKGLEQLWDLWYEVRKNLPRKVAALQDKLRERENSSFGL